VNHNSSKKITLDKDTSVKLSNLEKKLEEMLANTSSNTGDPIAVNAQKFTVYKKAFEEYNNICNQTEGNHTLANKIANGYNEIMKSILNQYSATLEKMTNYSGLSKKLAETNKILEDKNMEVIHLKAKLNEYEKAKNNKKTPNLVMENIHRISIKSSVKIVEIQSQSNNIAPPVNQNNLTPSSSVLNNSYILPIEKSEHNKIISEMNKNMIDDLEALYFGDKVHMRSNSVNINKIPKLNFIAVEEKMEKANKDQEKENKNHAANVNQLNKIEEAKKQLKDFKQKNENINLPVQQVQKDNFFNTKQLKLSNQDDSFAFLNKINNFTTKHNQANILNYNK